MLSNTYFLAKFRFDTAENGPAKNLQLDSRLGAAAQPVGLLLVSVGQLLLSLSTTAAESLKRRK